MYFYFCLGNYILLLIFIHILDKVDTDVFNFIITISYPEITTLLFIFASILYKR